MKIRNGAMILSVLCLLMTLSACRPKEPIKADDFGAIAERQGYTVVDIVGYEESPEITRSIGVDQDDFHLEFLELDGTGSASTLYASMKLQTEGKKSAVSAESSVSIGTTQKYTVKTGGRYYVVEQVGATFFYADCAQEKAGAVDAMLKEMGY